MHLVGSSRVLAYTLYGVSSSHEGLPGVGGGLHCFRTLAKQLDVVLQLSGIESHNSLGYAEHMHQPLCSHFWTDVVLIRECIQRTASPRRNEPYHGVEMIAPYDFDVSSLPPLPVTTVGLSSQQA